MFEWDKHYARRMSRMQGSEIRELLKVLNEPGIISFAGGIPDPHYFPTKEIAAACTAILSDPKRAHAALQYAASEGYLPLREWLAEYMTKQGASCGPDNILITNGSQQGLDFVGKLFITPKDTVLSNWPTYVGALQAFNAYEPNYEALPSPGSNQPLDSYIKSGKPAPKFIYVTPEFSNPSGLTLSLSEREALLNFAAAVDAPIVEDHAYEKLRFDGETVPNILSLAIKRAGSIDRANVVYLGTFSKSIAPSLRIGWVVAPKEVIGKLILLKQGADLHTSPFNQMIMHEVAPKIIERHTAQVREIYKLRRDAMLAALEQYMPQGVNWTRPEGGMFIWLTVDPSIDMAKLLQQSLATVKVAFVPGAAFFPDRSHPNTARLNYSLNEPAVIEDGIKRLARLITEYKA